MQILPKKIPHAVLFSGGGYEEKWQTVLQWIDYLLPAQKFTHPDLLTLPECSENTIKIDDIRKAIAHLQQSSHQGGPKIVVIKQADTLQFAAAHALLKILEEPPLGSYIFLISEYPDLLPQTLRSRCQKVNLPLVKTVSDVHIEALQQTLIQVTEKKITAFQAAAKWQSTDFPGVLDGLFYCGLLQRSPSKELFYWYDLLNETRRQVLNKQNPNHLLALENLFYQWGEVKLTHEYVG